MFSKRVHAVRHGTMFIQRYEPYHGYIYLSTEAKYASLPNSE